MVVQEEEEEVVVVQTITRATAVSGKEEGEEEFRDVARHVSRSCESRFEIQSDGLR